MKFKISYSKLCKGLVRVRGRSDDGQEVRWSGEVQVNVSEMSGERQISI